MTTDLQESCRSEDYVASMLWALSASNKSGHNKCNQRSSVLRHLALGFSADAAFIADIGSDTSPDRKRMRLSAGSIYTGYSRASRSFRDQLILTISSVPESSELFASDEGSSYRMFTASDHEDVFYPFRGTLGGLLRGQVTIAGNEHVIVVAWREEPKSVKATTLYQLGPAVLQLWIDHYICPATRNDLRGPVPYREDLVFSKVSQLSVDEETRRHLCWLSSLEQMLDSAIREWSLRHSAPDIPFLVSGRNAYTPRQIAQQVFERTPFAQKLLAEIIRSSTERLLGRPVF